LYAADSNTGNVLRFSRDGSHEVVVNLPHLAGFPNAIAISLGGTLFVQTGEIPLNLYRIHPTGEYELVASDAWGDPVGLAFDSQGNLYLSRGGTIDRLKGLTFP
jgi:sugar lactone lactonase YvrE